MDRIDVINLADANHIAYNNPVLVANMYEKESASVKE